jgi:hypothetical protein
MTTYTSFWARPARDMTAPHRSPGDTADGVLQLRVTPHGYDGHAYFVLEQARSMSDKKFKTIEEQRLPGDEGAREVVRRFLAFRAARQGVSQELFAMGSLVLFPADLQNSRPKTADECRLDAAALWLECEDFTAAQAALDQCAGASQDTLYWHTLARRLCANRADGLSGEEREAAWSDAVIHAGHVIAELAGKDLYRLGPPAPYYFGDSYRSPQSMLVYAAETAAEYLLDVESEPQRALQVIQIGEDTHHGSSGLQELKVKALLRLNRVAEAHQSHLHWRLQMPEVLASDDYAAFVNAQAQAAQQTQAKRVAAMRVEFVEGEPASPQEIGRLWQAFPQLPAAYLEWMNRADLHEMRVVDGVRTESYRRLSTDAAREKHGEILGWLHLHDESSPELAQEIQAHIRDSGIDPLQMLPIVGADHTPDCFLLRLDGQGDDAGAVYFWSHDECAVFERVVDGIEGLYPWLRELALAGRAFVL